jgi:hypothetical protein
VSLTWAVVTRLVYRGTRLWSGIRAAAPCWVLWAGRLLSVRAVDYQVGQGRVG